MRYSIAPRARFLGGRRRDLDAGGFQPRGDFAQRRLIANLPSDEVDVVIAARLEDESMVILVHPQERRAVRVGAVQFQTEDVGGEALPSRKIAHAEAQATQLCHTRHRALLRRRRRERRTPADGYRLNW
jgi:hypothetical protein